jgi:CRISPR-associated protein Csd1
MLHRLREYALKAGVSEPGFKPQAIRWAVVFSQSGEYRRVKELGDSAMRRNPGMVFARCPRMDQVGNVIWSQFLWHDLERLLAWPKDPNKKDRAAGNQRFFLDRLLQAAEVWPPLRACAAALAETEMREKAINEVRSRGAKQTDTATIQVGEAFPLLDERLLDWWRKNRERIAGLIGNREAKSAAEISMRCFVSGELANAAKVHPFVQGMADVGGNAKSALVSFNEPAYRSFGLEQSTNAAVSEQAAKEYTDALNTLIRTRSRRLISQRSLQRVRKGRGSVPMWTAERPKAGQDAKVVLWFSREDVNEAVDSDILLDPSPLEGAAEAVAAQAEMRGLRLLSAIQRGERPDLDGTNFYCAILSAATSRVMVRQWQEGPLRQFADAVSRWFADLEIVDAVTGERSRDPAFGRLIGALSRKASDAPPAAVLGLWLAATARREIPTSVQAQALRRMGTEIVTGAGARAVSAALLKACVLRSRRKGNGVEETIAPGLREDHPDPAYQCGRLMAELAALQKAALGEVGAGVIQRYFTAASATPGLVFGRLLRNSQHHLEKLQPGLRHLLEGRIAAIVARIGDAYPEPLDLGGQSMFALGYYQQIAENRRQQQIHKTKKAGQ